MTPSACKNVHCNPLKLTLLSIESSRNFTNFQLCTGIISHNSLISNDRKKLNISPKSTRNKLSNNVFRFNITPMMRLKWPFENYPCVVYNDQCESAYSVYSRNTRTSVNCHFCTLELSLQNQNVHNFNRNGQAYLLVQKLSKSVHYKLHNRNAVAKWRK